MFRREDYWPYMFGVFVLAGLVVVPIIWGLFIDDNLPYARLVSLSIVGCFVFAYGHTRDGKFAFGRFLLGLGLIFLMSLRISARSGGMGAFIPGGVLGFLVMSGCGWLGIGIARALGISQSIAKDGNLTLSKVEERLDVLILRLKIDLAPSSPQKEINLRDTLLDSGSDIIKSMGISEVTTFSNFAHLITSKIVVEEDVYNLLDESEKEMVIYDTSVLVKIDFDHYLIDYYCAMPINKKAEHLIMDECRNLHPIITRLLVSTP